MRRFPEAMPCLYKTKKDLVDRLDGSLCRYDDKLVYVRVIGEYDEEEDQPINYLQLYQWPESDKKFKKIKPDDPLFDISALDMGYMNYYVEDKNVVLYLTRSTAKKYKQGTCSNYIYVKEIDGKGSQTYSSYVYQSQGFVDMINHQYPGIEALKKVGQVALSPDLAVRRDDLDVLEFFWRGIKIAVKVPGSKIHRLETDYSWLVDKVLGGYDAVV